MKLEKESHMKNWTLAVGGIISIVGTLLALKDTKTVMPITLPWSFGRDNNSSEKSLLIPGLHNLQNNCFLNVVLQALASCFCFRSFLHSVIRECGTEDLVEERMPLAVSLASLLDELSSLGTEKVVLSPKNMMLAMSQYIPDFNLTSQQDAAEAFLHVLCSLREESGGCYAPKVSSLADIFASNNRIHTPIQRDWQSEQERWHQLFLGPFDGILSSTLVCQSCSTQISINLERFDCLPLSPVLNDSFSIRVGCKLVDCLKQFIVAERVENYQCSHCWHCAAIKYLSSMGANEVELKKLRRCSDQELCDCGMMCKLERLPWSKRFSHTLKKLSIGRCPRILCIQLKRVHMNAFGEPVKLQGHIAFPLILDMLSFMTARVGVSIPEGNVPSLPLDLQYNGRNSLPNQHNLQSETRKLKFSGIYGEAREQINTNDFFGDGFASSTNREVDDSCNSVSQETCLYQLVSVVEHFGRAGSGHYTVYRCVRVESAGDVSEDFVNQTLGHWFCASDSQVYAVSEEDVLSAEASLLFYERIPLS